MTMRQGRNDEKKLFVSWSGDNSKQIAIELKNTLENQIFNGSHLVCFVSDDGIASGDDWWSKINKELKKCKLGIACITKENLKAPWIYFETGAMTARDLSVIPLLINCDFNALNKTPLSNKHMVEFLNKEKFKKMVKDINKKLQLLQISDNNLDKITESAYIDMIKKLNPILKHLKFMRMFHEKYIYPSNVRTVNLNTMYISAPMSSILKSEYYELRDFLLELKPVLIDIGFMKIECPIFENSDYNNFDGSTKAIRKNFVKMKQVDTMIVIYPQPSSSSVLVEIGYGLALCKKTVIFYKEGNQLPYILRDASTNIGHIDIRSYKSYADIKNIITSNGMKLFKMNEEE